MSKYDLVEKLKKRENVDGLKLFRKSDNCIITIEHYINDIHTMLEYDWKRYNNGISSGGGATCHIANLIYMIMAGRLTILSR